jgi:hypothetical protein
MHSLTRRSKHGLSGIFAVGHRDGSLPMASTTSMYIERNPIFPVPVASIARRSRVNAVQDFADALNLKIMWTVGKMCI